MQGVHGDMALAYEPDGGNYYRDRFSNTQPTPGGGTPRLVFNRDNVLQIGALIQRKAEELQERVEYHARRMITEPALGDPASADGARVLNEKLVFATDSYANRARQYVRNLFDAVEQCRAAARDYGYTDEQIEAAFNNLGDQRA
jgi:hypothetical protein